MFFVLIKYEYDDFYDEYDITHTYLIQSDTEQEAEKQQPDDTEDTYYELYELELLQK